MTVGGRLRSKVASGLPSRGPRGRGRREGDEEANAILEHLELDDEVAEGAASAERPGARSARRVHLAVLPERYEPLEEPVSGDKPKKKYRQKLKKYGKVGPCPLPWGAGVRGARSRASQLFRWGAGVRSPPCDCAQLLWAPPVSPSAPTTTLSPAFTTKARKTVPSVTWQVRGKFQVTTETKAEVSVGTGVPAAPPPAG